MLGVYAPTEGRRKLNKEFYETLQNILDNVNKNDYIILMGVINARVGNIRVANMVSKIEKLH